MNKIPIIFSIDNNVTIPCGVAITSLIKNARVDTCYDIYVLCDLSNIHVSYRNIMLTSFNDNKNCHISFIDVGRIYSDTKDVISGHITIAAFYRLAIPTLFPNFDKVIYADVDMIFQQDLSNLYNNSLSNDELIAAVNDLTIDDKFCFQSEIPSKIGCSVHKYFNSGFFIMNLKQMRLENIVDKFKDHLKIKYEQNDQDILNIVCKDRVQWLPSIYNFQLNHFANYMWGRKKSDICFDELFKKATLHYTWKHKPWNSLECVAADTWWHYYKMSPFYDDMVYFKRQYNQIESSRNDYHNLPNGRLFKRILINIKKKLFR